MAEDIYLVHVGLNIHKLEALVNYVDKSTWLYFCISVCRILHLTFMLKCKRRMPET